MSADAVTSLSLLKRAQARHAPSWDHLIALYRPLVLAWCRRAGLRPDEQLDVAQEVFLAVSLALPGFDRQRTGSFRAWLRGITRHKLLDFARDRLGHARPAGGTEALRQLHQLPDAPTEEEDAAEQSGVCGRALDLIRGEFEPRTFNAFWRAAVDGHRTDLIAAELGMSPLAVRIAKSRVLSRLREEAGELIA